MRVMFKLKGSGICKFIDNVSYMGRTTLDDGWLLTFDSPGCDDEEFYDADYALREVTL